MTAVAINFPSLQLELATKENLPVLAKQEAEIQLIQRQDDIFSTFSCITGSALLYSMGNKASACWNDAPWAMASRLSTAHHCHYKMAHVSSHGVSNTPARVMTNFALFFCLLTP